MGSVSFLGSDQAQKCVVELKHSIVSYLSDIQ